MGAGHALWWTFAGGRINQTLKYGLQLQNGWGAVTDNFRLTIAGEGLSFATLGAALAAMCSDEFWTTPANQRRLLALLPVYRLSKFQRVLPEHYASEMIRDYVLDIAGTVQWLHAMGRMEV
jgi:ATP-dependent Lhr-like helicase